MTQLNAPGTQIPCGNVVIKTTPKGRKILAPAFIPDMPSAVRLMMLGFSINNA